MSGMPELPEVETVRRGLAPVMEGREFSCVEMRRPDLRFPMPDRFVERLEGVCCERLGRRAKFLTAELSSGETLIMHLGMSGRFIVKGQDQARFANHVASNAIHDHVVFEMEDGSVVTFNDPRRFGFMELMPTLDMTDSPRFAGMGPEPLSDAFDADYLTHRLRGKNTSIKAALLDQSIIAGLGNIYVCEALFRAGVSPKRLSKSVSGKRASRLVDAINAVIAQAIEAGGSSISDFTKADGSLGYFQHNFAVYGRENEPCIKCQSTVKRLVQSGRSSFFCSICQR